MWFRMDEDSYIDIVYNDNEFTYSGVRLSSSDLYPSMIYEAEQTGKFLKKEIIDTSLTAGFHSATLQSGKLTVSGKEIKVPGDLFRNGKVGTLVSFLGSELFSFQAEGAGKKFLLHFIPEGARWGLYARHLLIILVPFFLMGFFPRGQKLFPVLVLGLGSIAWVYSLTISPSESLEAVVERFEVMDAWWTPDDHPTLSEKIKTVSDGKVFSGVILCRPEGCRTLARDENPPPKKGKRILLFGGSRSMPSLVRETHQSFYYTLDRELRKVDPSVETMNAYSSGLLKKRLEKFGKHLREFDFDEMIFESLTSPLEISLTRQFVKDWDSRGVKIYYLMPLLHPGILGEKLAPIIGPEFMRDTVTSFPRGTPGSVLNVFPFLYQLREETGIILLNPNKVFLDKETMNSGELFWDGHHLTGWGQKILAEWIVSEYTKQ